MDKAGQMNAPWEMARELQKPPPAGALKVVRRDAKEDTPREATIGA